MEKLEKVFDARALALALLRAMELYEGSWIAEEHRYILSKEEAINKSTYDENIRGIAYILLEVAWNDTTMWCDSVLFGEKEGDRASR